MSRIAVDELFALARAREAFSVPASWTQGRTVYGGLTAALLVECIRVKIGPDKTLRALNVAFSAPTVPDVDFELETELLREGKTIAQWQGRLVQRGVVCVQVLAVFGSAVESELAINSFSVPDIPGYQDAIQWPTDLQAGFTQYFLMAQSQGDMPVSGGQSLELGGWMRFRDAPEEISVSHLIAMIDVWPPATMMQMTELKAGSTVNWTLQFPQPLPSLETEDYAGYQARIEYSQNGYGFTHARIWNRQNQLLALSQQTVIVYG